MSEIASKADLNDALQKVGQFVERERQALTEPTEYATENTGNALDDLSAIVADASFVGGDSLQRAARNTRASKAAFLKKMIVDLYTAILYGYLKAAGYPDTGRLDATAFQRIREYMADGTAATVKNRNITVDSTIGSQVGTGALTYRVCDTDAYGRKLEAVYPGKVKVRAIATGSTVPHLRERIELRSEAQIDALSYRVSGEGKVPTGRTRRREIQIENADRGGMRNLSFDSQSSEAVLSTPGGWTVDTLANVTVVDDGYRASVAEKALIDAGTISNGLLWRATSNVVIQQKLRGVVDNICYDGGVWVRRNTGVTAGTLTLTIGGVTVTQNLASLTAGTWTLVALPLDENNWARQIKSGEDFKIAITGYTGTTAGVDLDSAFFNPMQELNGLMWNVIQDGTALSVDYEGEFEHDTPDQGYIQQHMLIGFGDDGAAGRNAFLNSAASPTIAETGF